MASTTAAGEMAETSEDRAHRGRASADIRWRTLSVLLLLLPGLVAAANTVRKPTAPGLSVSGEQNGLVFSEYLIHFGERPVPAQPVLTPTFVFRNVGQHPVRLEQITPSCGCVKPEVSTREVAPGDSGRLTVPIRTAGEQPGFHEYLVNVRYTDPRPREVTLTVKVVLPEQAVMIEPKALFLMGQFSGDTEHQVTITDFRETPLSVQSLTTSSPFLTSRIISSTRDAEGTRTIVGVKVLDSLPPGNQRGLVHARTNDPVYPLLQIPLLMRTRERAVAQEVQVRPELVNMSARISDTPSRVLITLPKSWTVSHIDTAPEELQVQYSQQAAEQGAVQRLQLDLSFTQLPDSPLQHGVVNIYANDNAEMVSVPVQFSWPLTDTVQKQQP